MLTGKIRSTLLGLQLELYGIRKLLLDDRYLTKFAYRATNKILSNYYNNYKFCWLAKHKSKCYFTADTISYDSLYVLNKHH